MKNINLCADRFFLSSSECAGILTSILSFQEKVSIPHVVRHCKERSLNYRVIDGRLIEEHFPEVAKLSYEVQKLVDAFSDIPLAPLANKRVAVNINITPPDGEYRWHYDRNLVTAVLYLNEISGGEIEIFEDYRILLNSRRVGPVQRFLDRVLLTKLSRWIFSGKRRLIAPRAGELIVMKANRCLHSVRRVHGSTDRVCIVFAYDTPGRSHNVNADLDPYLYSNQPVSAQDPNYANGMPLATSE